MTISKKILVKGFVQEVSYRKQTRSVASRLGVDGWVRNRNDSSVEAWLQGDEQAVDALIAWCAFGSKKSKVDEVVIADSRRNAAYSGFRILEDYRDAA